MQDSRLPRPRHAPKRLDASKPSISSSSKAAQLTRSPQEPASVNECSAKLAELGLIAPDVFATHTRPRRWLSLSPTLGMFTPVLPICSRVPCSGSENAPTGPTLVPCWAAFWGFLAASGAVRKCDNVSPTTFHFADCRWRACYYLLPNHKEARIAACHKSTARRTYDTSDSSETRPAAVGVAAAVVGGGQATFRSQRERRRQTHPSLGLWRF